MAKIADLPALADAEVDGTEQVPVIKGAVTRRASVTQLGRFAAERAEAAAATAQALANYRPTIAGALALTDQEGEAFTSDEGGTLLAYRRTAGAPFYERAAALDPAGKFMAIGLFSALAATAIPGGTEVIRSSGHGVRGVGAAFYRLVAPADIAALPAEGQGVWWQTSVNGRTFELAESEPNLFQYGAVAGGNVSVTWPIADRHVERTDSTLIIPPARFTGNVILGGLATSRTRFRGTRPVRQIDNTRLQYGSILQGTLWVKSLHHECVGVGVDHGSAWFADLVDVFKVSPYIDGIGPVAGTYSLIVGCVALGATRTGATHGFLAENLNNGLIDDIEGWGYFFSVALKMVRCRLGLVRGYAASPNGGRCTIVKADAQFGGNGSNDMATFVCDGAGDASYGFSLLLQDDQQMERITIGTVLSFGSLNPTACEVENGSTLNDLIFDRIISVSSGGNINNAALILRGAIANPKIGSAVLKPSVGARGFFFSGLTAVEMKAEVIVPEGGLLSQAGYVHNCSSSNLDVKATQNGDLGILGFINYDDAGGGIHRITGMSQCIPYPVGAAKVPLRPNMVSDAIPNDAKWYNAGEFVRKSILVADGNNMAVMGWSRVTSSDAHVAGADWRAAYVSLVSPAT